jgi:hypothetical protein
MGLRSLPDLRCFWRRFGVVLGGAVAAPENGDALNSAIMYVMRGRRNANKTVIVCWFTVGYVVKKPGSCCRSMGKPLTDSRNISKYL